MQVLKRFLIVCTALFGTGLISVAAPDTPGQAKAREALHKKMAELDRQGAAVETPAPLATEAEKKATPTPAPQPSPATVAPTPPAPALFAAAAFATLPTPETISPTEETARQREAVRRKIAELEAQEPATQTSPAPAATETVVKPLEKKAADVIEAEKEAAAAEAQRLAAETKAREEAEQAAAAEAGKQKAEGGKKKTKTVAEVPPSSFAPLQAPPPAISGSKEAKLADLLRRYKADEIAAEEYHKQRASILAGP